MALSVGHAQSAIQALGPEADLAPLLDSRFRPVFRRRSLTFADVVSG